MRFIIHTQYYPPEVGAPQARLSEFAESLHRNGHEVTVMTAIPNYPTGRFYSGYGAPVSREVIKGVPVIRSWIYPSKSIRLIPRLTNYFSFVFSSLLAGAALLPKADYILTESPPLFLGISGYLLSRLKGAKWIFNVSDLWPESAVRLGVIGQGLPLRISERLETFCYRKAWLVTGQSREILNGVKRKVADAQTYHFSNGVDSSLFKPSLRSEKVHAELGEGSECVAVYAGLHGLAQGLGQIVEAAGKLRDLEGRLKIVFIGDGPEKKALLKRSAGFNMLKFLPSRAKGEIPELLASADIAIVPLKNYIPGAVPSKIYESMASALPVILSAGGEAANIVDEAQAGINVSPGAIGDLAQAIRRLALDGGLRKKLGENGLRAARERFDRRRIIGNFSKFLEDNP